MGGVVVGLAVVVGGAVLVTGGVALGPWWPHTSLSADLYTQTCSTYTAPAMLELQR